MATQLKKIWQFLNTDLKELCRPTGTVEAGAEVSKTALEFAIAIGFLGSSLSPASIAVAGLSFAGIAAKGIRFYRDKTNKELTLEECVSVAVPLAYLESFDELVKTNDLLRQLGANPRSNIIKQDIEQLEELRIDEYLARKALSYFTESELAKAFNQLLSTQLQQAGINQQEADILTGWVAWGTQGHLIKALQDSEDSVRQLTKAYITGNDFQSKYSSITTYLEKQIATKALETVFAESFTFQDIYVPLEAQPVNTNGEKDKEVNSVKIEAWAKTILADEQKLDKVMFIQGSPGRGKSVFCRMFADWVRQHLHPVWTPILICLRDIRTFEKSFEKILQASVGWDFSTSDDGWLTDRNTRFLFLLDGFDELLLERGNSQGLKDFLWQVDDFQSSCKRNPEKGHRVLITGRPLALQGIEGRMPPNLERVELLPMDNRLQKQWFRKWSQIFGTDTTSAFQQFLQDQSCPEKVRNELAKEPLLLYLLAAMHRDGKLTVEMFAGASSAAAKIKVYEQSLEWVLTKQREEWLNRELTGQETEGLRRILSEAGLCVVQSGGECAAMEMIESRLKGDDTAICLIQKAREHHGNDALKNALAAFYLQPASGDKEGSVEFCHKSFGEFLCAERLKESLIDWTQPGTKRYQEFNVSTERMDWEIYDLLGYGGLTREIVDYLMALLTASDEFRPEQLFKRLENFYLRWCDGEFIDAFPKNLPQEKMLALREQLKTLSLGLRQVDIYAGLNVMILLLELNRYAQWKDDLKDKIAFYPCGEKDTDSFDVVRLLQIIGYSYCIGVTGFSDTVGCFLSCANFFLADLSGAYLSGVDLSCVNLSRTNLSGADLSGANLSRANLSGANLSGANLSGTNLCSTDLINADLSGAYLGGAYLILTNLSGVDLSGAYLCRANLSGAKLYRADLSGANINAYAYTDVNDNTQTIRTNLDDITWDEYTNWENIRGLETAENVPEALKKQLGIN